MTWSATTGQILALREHLVAAKVTCVVIETTSDYWKPFHYLLDDALDVALVNARACAICLAARPTWPSAGEQVDLGAQSLGAAPGCQTGSGKTAARKSNRIPLDTTTRSRSGNRSTRPTPNESGVASKCAVRQQSRSFLAVVDFAGEFGASGGRDQGQFTEYRCRTGHCDDAQRHPVGSC
jgi:hypothetical protein